MYCIHFSSFHFKSITTHVSSHTHIAQFCSPCDTHVSNHTLILPCVVPLSTLICLLILILSTFVVPVNTHLSSHTHIVHFCCSLRHSSVYSYSYCPLLLFRSTFICLVILILSTFVVPVNIHLSSHTHIVHFCCSRQHPSV